MLICKDNRTFFKASENHDPRKNNEFLVLKIRLNAFIILCEETLNDNILSGFFLNWWLCMPIELSVTPFFMA